MNSESPTTTGPINVSLPNVTKEKMQAIVHLSKAVLEMAQALNRTHTEVTISNNIIQGAELGISVDTQDA